MNTSTSTKKVLFTSAALALLLTGCKNNPYAVVSPEQATIATQQTLTLTAAAKNADGTAFATAPKFTWASNNTAVATVSDTGVVTGIKDGNATITATADGGLSDTSAITVSTPVLLEGFENGLGTWGKDASVGGTLTIGSEHVTEGSKSLKVAFTTKGAVSTLVSKADWSGKSKLVFDLYSDTAGTIQLMSLSGPSWMLSTAKPVAVATGANTIEVPFSSYSPALALSSMVTITIDQNLGANATIHIDNIRLQ